MQCLHHTEELESCTSRVLLITLSLKILHLHGRLEVEAGREVFALTSKYNCSNITIVATKVLDHLLQLVEHLKGDGIEFASPVDGNNGNLVLVQVFNFDELKLRFLKCAPHILLISIIYVYI